MQLSALEIQTEARKLYESMGAKAMAEAARRARTHAGEGRNDDAETWRRIESALRIMSGPRAS